MFLDKWWFRHFKSSATSYTQILNVGFCFGIWILFTIQAFFQDRDKMIMLAGVTLWIELFVAFFIGGLYLFINIFDNLYPDYKRGEARFYMLVWTGLIIVFNTVIFLVQNFDFKAKSFLDFCFFQFLTCFFNMAVTFTFLARLPVFHILYHKANCIEILGMFHLFQLLVMTYFHMGYPKYGLYLFISNVYYMFFCGSCGADFYLVWIHDEFQLGQREVTPSWGEVTAGVAKLEVNIRKNRNPGIEQIGLSPSCKICKIGNLDPKEYFCHYKCNHVVCIKCAVKIDNLEDDVSCVYCSWLERIKENAKKEE